MLLNKYFSFGDSQNQINAKWVWFDSFNQAKAASYSCVFDALSAKFNYGVCHARIACYMDLTQEKGVPKACKHMQQAAWVFEDLK